MRPKSVVGGSEGGRSSGRLVVAVRRWGKRTRWAAGVVWRGRILGVVEEEVKMWEGDLCWEVRRAVLLLAGLRRGACKESHSERACTCG